MHRFDIPFYTHELCRQPVEQFLVRRRFALRAEILRRFHNPDSEVLLPNSIDRDPGRQRIVCIDQPARQRQSVQRRALRQRMKHRRSRGCDDFAFAQKPAANKPMRFAWFVQFHHDRRDRNQLIQSRFTLPQFRKLVADGLQLRRYGAEIFRQFGLFLVASLVC